LGGVAFMPHLIIERLPSCVPVACLTGLDLDVSCCLFAGEVNGQLLALALGALAVSLSTEILKFARGMQGGDTGTGGRF
jgi:hypothetical protein